MKRKVYMIGNAHLDPVWLWKWQEGYAETQATFRSALDRMEEFDDFVFCCAGALAYRWVEENDPEMFGEIRRRVTEGRWVIVGGWWVQPDCNMPDGEAFARHSLYGQRYFLEKFSVMAKTGYNVDSFGHNPMLPQILKKSGMDQYVFMRPAPNEKDLPGNLFWWEAPDESRVLAYRIPACYTFRGKTTEEMSDFLDKAVKEVAQCQDIDMMCFYGVGNHGGGPTIENLKMLHEIQAGQRDETVVIGSTDDYFRDMRKQNLELPVVADSLLMHAPGCYATTAEVKRIHRRAEQRLMACEKMLVLSGVLKAMEYPAGKMGEAWDNVLFNTFHDILCGCSIKDAYDDVFAFYGESLSVSSKLMNRAMQRISWSIDTMPGEGFYLSKEKDWKLYEKDEAGIPVVVFNPHSFAVTRMVRLNQRLSCVEDRNRRVVPFQNITGVCAESGEVRTDTVFETKLPPYGYEVYWIYLTKQAEQTEQAEQAQSALRITETEMENELYRLVFNKSTASVSVYDKASGKQISGGAALPVVIEDIKYDTWAHGAQKFDNECGRFTAGKTTIIDDGPLMVRMRFESRYGTSVIEQVFTMYSGRAQIDIDVRLNWQEPYKRLKLAFPLNAEDCVCTYDIPFGFVRTETDGVEYPCQKWTDISGKAAGKAVGFTVLNDGKYSVSAAGNELRLTAVRSPQYADHCAGGRDRPLPNMDMGISEFRYAILPYGGEPDAHAIVMAAREFNTEPMHVVETYHKGSLPQSYSGLTVTGGAVVAEAVKRAEDDDGYILRLFETAGTDCSVSVDFSLLNVSFETRFGKHEIKTFRISDAGSVNEVNLLEM